MKRRGLAIALLAVAAVTAVIWTARTLGFKPPIPRMNAARNATAGGEPAASPARIVVPPTQAASDVFSAPLPAPGTPFMQIYGDLKARVAQGDHRAACRIGYELDRCKKLPSIRNSPEFWRKVLTDTALPAARRATAEKNVESAERTLREAEVACRGVPESEFPKAWDYSLASAIAGNGYATWKISFFPPGLDPVNREETLEGWIQWRQYVPGLMEDAVRRGDPRLVSLASRDSHMPREGMRVRVQDPIKAVGYEMALLAGASETYRPTVQRNIEGLIQRLKLSAPQVEEARAFAATVKLNVPAGGIDWSRGMDPDMDVRQCEQS